MARSSYGQRAIGSGGRGAKSRALARRKFARLKGLRPLVEALERRDLLAGYTTPEDTPFAVSDSTMAGATIVTAPAHGKAYLSNTGGFLYSPDLNYNGSDRFTYSVNPNGTTPPAVSGEISITISPVNDAPVAHGDQFLVQQNVALSIEAPGVLKNDTDVDSDHLTAVVGSQPSHGTLALKDSGAFVYTPATDYTGPDSFTYSASDGQATSDAATVSLYVSKPPKPEARNDSYGIPQNTVLNVAAPGVLGNDSGINGRGLTASLVPDHGPLHGKVEVRSDGSFSYTPATDYVGYDTFVYRATDISPLANPLPAAYADATVTIYVRSTAPIVVANNDVYYAIQNSPLPILTPGVLKNDYVLSADANSATGSTTPLNIPLTSVIVSNPGHGTVDLAADGSFKYTPAKDFVGADTFTYRAVMSPPAGSTTAPAPNPSSHDVATVTINVKAYNPAPEAHEDSYGIPQDATLKIDAPGVLANDKGVDGHKLATIPGDKPAHGDLTLNADGSFTYTPAAGYVGTDIFSYRAVDTSVQDPNANAPPTSNPAKVTIYVRSTAPIVVANNDVYYATTNTPLGILAPGVLANDFVLSPDSTNTSPNLNKLNIPLTSVIVSGPGHGTLDLASDGSFKYTSATGFVGADTFTYRAVMSPTVGGTTTPAPNPSSHDVATVTINVKAPNPSPEAHDDSYGIPQDTTLKIDAPGVLANDKGVDGHKLNAVLGDKPAHGDLTLNADGSFSYTPAAGYVGADVFSYRAVDTSVQDPTANAPPTSNLAKVTIYVRSTAPVVVANNDVYYAIAGLTLGIPPKGVLTNDYVLSADASIAAGSTTKLDIPLAAKLVTDASHGTLTLNADGSFKYTPADGFVGTDTFSYQAIISPAVGSTTPPTINPSSHDTATVTIYVRAPVAVANNDTYATLQNMSLGVEAPGVLKNDYVIASDATLNGAPGTSGLNIQLTAVYVSGPSHGKLGLNADGSFKYMPDLDFVGADSFVYKASLGVATTATGGTNTDPNFVAHDTATVTIYVKAVNPPPAANNDYFRVLQDTALVADPPGVLANDHGPDGHKLAAVLDKTTPNGTLSLTDAGGFTYTPNSGFTGIDTFTYHFIDTTSTDSPPPSSNVATVTIYVQPAHPPVYAYDDYYKVTAGAMLSIEKPGVLGNDTLVPPPLPLSASGDVNGPVPIPYPNLYTITATLLQDVSHGKVTLNADGSFTYTPEANFTGADTFTYQASASPTGTTNPPPTTTANSTAGANIVCSTNGDCPTPPDDVATVTIYVKAPEPPPGPRAANDFYLTAENTPLGIGAPGVLANDAPYCPPNAPCVTFAIGSGSDLTAILVASPTHGTVSLNGNGSFKYEPAADFVGTDTFTYQASGPTTATLSNIATVTIRVVPAIAHGDSYATDQNVTLAVTAPGVLGNDSGGSHDHPLIATPLNSPMHGTLSLNADGSFKYAPNAGYSGPDYFTYRASDGTTTNPGDPNTNGLSTPNALDVGYVKIYVRPIVRGIEAHDDKYLTHINEELKVDAPGVLANDFGPVNVLVAAAIGDKPAHGSVTLNANGSFSYTPDPDYTGEDKFTYTASAATAAGTDGGIKSSTATVLIYVLAADPAPKVIISGDQSSTDESGPQKVIDFAAGVTVGDDGQPAPLTVTTDNPKLFAAPPAIDATGQLVYTPAHNVSGDANITVTMHDETAGDTTQTFIIHIDKPHPLFNAANMYDVNGNTRIEAADALDIINWINAKGNMSADAAEGEEDPSPFYDVSRDNLIGPLDALMVINAINAGLTGSEGEADSSVDAGLLALVAQDAAEVTMGRKRN